MLARVDATRPLGRDVTKIARFHTSNTVYWELALLYIFLKKEAFYQQTNQHLIQNVYRVSKIRQECKERRKVEITSRFFPICEVPLWIPRYEFILCDY